jgi:methionyl-tRNA synthetase
MAENRQPGSKFYVTSSIAYVNGDPHIGYAAELTQVDALARWHRLIGDDTFFLTGTDENSQKLIKVAEQAKTTPQAIADKYSARFKDLTKKLNLTNDDFIRTTDEQRHFPGATTLWQKLVEKDLIYKGKYQGLYCVDCEQYYGADELIDGKCPVHGTVPERVEEENYFFKLSQFREQLLDRIESGAYEVRPESRRNEVISFLKGELKDISFSRPAHKLEMGVPVPGDDSQRMYVWCDALTNYMTGVGYGWDEKKYRQWWPADLHIIGKDIWKFHAVYWPAMLLGAGLELPKQLYVHGFFSMDGKKMSKSKGNVVDPFAQIEQHGADAVRYYLVRSLPYAEDGDYSERRFKEIYDSELANDFGNLASRVLTLVDKKCSGTVPEGMANPKLKEHVAQTHHEFANLLDALKLAEALERLNQLVTLANRFVEEHKVYQQDGPDRDGSLYTLVQVLGHLALLYQPFIPGKAGELQSRLGLKPDGWDAASLLEWEKVPPGTKVAKGEPLFPKK